MRQDPGSVYGERGVKLNFISFLYCQSSLILRNKRKMNCIHLILFSRYMYVIVRVDPWSVYGELSVKLQVKP